MIERLRARIGELKAGGDEGFILVYVLGIIAVVTILVGSTLVIASSNIIPTVRSTFSQAADAAARGGIQAFVAYADKYCADNNATVEVCALPSDYSDIVPISLNDDPQSNYTSQYAWSAQKDPDGRYFRVRSTGTVSQGGITISKTLVADVAGGASANLFDYGVVTGFESQSSSSVLAQWPRRTIALDSTAINAAGVPIKGGAITWSGASPGTAAGKVAVCNASFDQNGGRSNNLPHDAPNPYVDWTESGLQGNNYTDFQPCQTSWGTGTKLLAPLNPADGPGGYYSADAMLLSNSYPGGTGPLFDQPVKTGWRYQPDDAGICGTNAGHNYRSFDLKCAGYPVEVGGSPSPDSTAGEPQWAAGPSVPKSAPVIPADACVYAGPTRVRLDGDKAIVTSPQTTPNWVSTNAAGRPPQCYTGAGANGMALQEVSLVSPTAIHVIVATDNGTIPTTTPAIAHGSSGWPTTGQKAGDTASTSNSLFYLTSAAPPTTPDAASTAAPDDCATQGYAATFGATCAWTGVHSDTDSNGTGSSGWTSYSNGTNCAGLDATDRQQFECDWGGGTVTAGHDNYAALRSAIQGALGTNTCASGDKACFAALINTALARANSGGAPASSSTSPAVNDHRYLVTTSSTGNSVTPAPTKTLATNSAPAASDPFFDSTTTAGKPTVETNAEVPMTFTVGRQVAQCYGLIGGLLCGLGTGLVPPTWGDGKTSGASTPQFTVTISQSTWSITAPGQAGISSFPSMNDVTQYQMGTAGTFGASGPGDLYVDGTANQTMALVATDDTVITGPLTTSDIDTSTLEIVGQDNVRIYHPVSCKDTTPSAIATTDPGFCPNDITGLYTALPPDGSLPYQQYVNMRPDLAGLTVNGAVLALGNAPGHISCPQPPGGGGVCGGEITVDNFGRGTALGDLNFVGTIAMAHHAPAGLEWEIPDTSGQKGRAYSGYQLAERYQNLAKLISDTDATSGLLQTVSSTSSLWHIVSISSAPTTGGAS